MNDKQLKAGESEEDKGILDNEDELEINSDNDDAEEYPVNSIKVDKGFYTVFELKRKYAAEPKRVILDSDFQRNDVWNLRKKSELIESILMGLPLPIFYFNQDRYGRLIVVDGRQRLTAMFSYMDEKFKLRNLRVLKSINGKAFSELSVIQQGKIEDFQMQAHVIIPPTPERIKFDIFDRVNRGGMQLNKQEIRNAMYQGQATKLLDNIVRGECFKRATGDAFKNEKRMKDKYLISRLVAIILYLDNELTDDERNIYKYRGDIDDIQGRALDHINSQDKVSCDKVMDRINEALTNSYSVFGENAFRLSSGKKKTPINMNLFETIMTALIYKEDEVSDEYIKESIDRLIETETFRENIGFHRDGANNFCWRIETAKEIGRGEFKLDKIVKH